MFLVLVSEVVEIPLFPIRLLPILTPVWHRGPQFLSGVYWGGFLPGKRDCNQGINTQSDVQFFPYFFLSWNKFGLKSIKVNLQVWNNLMKCIGKVAKI